MTTATPNRTPRRRRHILSTVTGALLGLVALCVLAVGGYLVGMPKGGYMDLGHAAYRTDGRAVTTDPYDWSRASLLGGAFHDVRLTVDQGARPAFVGLAHPGELRRYLDGVDYATAHERPGHRVVYTRHTGAAPKTPPTKPSFWTAHATGTGSVTLHFTASQARGDLVLVAMNADGSPVVNGRVSQQAAVPALATTGTITFGVGLVLLVGAIALIVVPRRRSRARAVA